MHGVMSAKMLLVLRLYDAPVVGIVHMQSTNTGDKPCSVLQLLGFCTRYTRHVRQW